MKYHFFNIFITSHFETDKFNFRCVFDSDKTKVPRDIDVITHIAELKRDQELSPSLFFSDKNDTELKDISLLLTVAQGTHIFAKDQNVGRVLKYRKQDFELFLSFEVGDFLNQSSKNLSKMDRAKVDVIRTALLMFYEAKHFLFYDGLRIILMMNCFEFLVGSVYRQDKKYNTSNLKLQDSYKHIITKLDYQKFIDSKLKKEIKSQKLSQFKRKKKIPTIASFIDQFQKMRNWIAHGKQHKKPVFRNSPSDVEFTFAYRLESFIRIILLDLIYGKEYTRKFDVLYQLILEMNVVPTLTPEFPKLKFIEKK